MADKFSRRSFMKKVGIVGSSLAIGGAAYYTTYSNNQEKNINNRLDESKSGNNKKSKVENEGVHKGINQKPIPIKINRIDNNVNVEMTAQITDIEIDKGKIYKAWTFNGTVPGPVLRVKEGDTLNFSLKNIDPYMAHSVDFHAVYAAPDKDFADVEPNNTGNFSYTVGSPGVYMYHCATDPVLLHIGNGMYGTVIVEPENGWDTDKEIDREFTLIQSEFYKDGLIEEMLNSPPEHVVFNGDTFTLKEEPLKAKVNEKIRIYFNNVGPNCTSSFHVIGTQLEHVYIDGDPRNIQKGLQTILVPASGGAIVEFTCKKAGKYPIVTHQFNHATKGAIAILEVSE